MSEPRKLVKLGPSASNPSVIEHVLAVAPSPLLPGEKATEYRALAERFIATAKPKDAIEEMLLRDVIDLTWEELRLRRMKGELLKASTRGGVYAVLDDIGHSDGGVLYRRELSERWASGDSEAQSEVASALSKAGLTIEAIMARTLDVKLDSVERLDRMLASAEARRNNALREIDRHRETLGAATRRALEDPRDVEFREVGSGVTLEKHRSGSAIEGGSQS